MREVTIALPLLSLVAATRGMLGAGIGLLLADRLTLRQRRTAGWSLFLAGAASTVPLAMKVFGGMRGEEADARRRERHRRRRGEKGRGRQIYLMPPATRRRAPSAGTRERHRSV